MFVLRELQATLRICEAERNRLQTQLVTKHEDTRHLKSRILSLEQELDKMRVVLIAYEQEAHPQNNTMCLPKMWVPPLTPSGGSTPPLSCHSQNPADANSPDTCFAHSDPPNEALSEADPAGFPPSVTYCVTCGDSNARFLNEATNARFLDDPNHTQSLREKLVGFDASGITQVQRSLYQMCLELRGTQYQMCLELEGVEEELHLFRALPVLCEACNGNAERRWRPKAKMTQWLSSRSIEREEKRQLQATDVSDATPLSFNSSRCT